MFENPNKATNEPKVFLAEDDEDDRSHGVASHVGISLSVWFSE